jgi:hypothetical protein
VKPQLFLGRGQAAKWFVLHQALNIAHLHREYECSIWVNALPPCAASLSHN